VGGDRVDRGEDRLHGRDVATLGPPSRAGLTADERQRLKELERENRELKRANEILKLASAFFAKAELDRRAK
jgi:transposase-like protein